MSHKCLLLIHNLCTIDISLVKKRNILCHFCYHFIKLCPKSSRADSNPWTLQDQVHRDMFARFPRSNRPARHDAQLATHLLWLVVVVMVPLLLLTGIEIWRLHESNRRVQENALLEQAREKTELVDHEFVRIETAIYALAASSSLEQRDFDRFDREMRTVSAQLGGMSIGLAGPDGHQILLTQWPVGVRKGGMVTGPGALAALAQGRITITNLHRSPVTGEVITALAVPIYHDGGSSPAYAITAIMPAARVASIIDDQHVPQDENLAGALLDQNGVIVAHTLKDGEVVGQKIRSPLLEHLRGASEGFVRNGGTIDGKEAFFTFVRTISGGYTVVLGVPREVFDAPLRADLIRTFVIGALLLGAGALTAGWLAQRLVRPLHRLAGSHSGQPVRSGIREIDNLALQLHLSAEARDRAQAGMVYQLTLLRAVTESTADAIFLMDPQGHVAYANPGSEQMFGWGQDELIGRTLQNVVHGECSNGTDSAAWDSTLNRIVAAGRPCVREEDVFFRCDGGMVMVEYSYAPVVIDNNSAGAVLTVRDITARKRFDAALRENEARLCELVSTLDLAKIMVRDPDGTIRFWSHGCERLYGWSVAEAVGQSLWALLYTSSIVPPDEIDGLLLRDGEWSGDLIQTCRDGSRITVAVRKVLQRDAKGEPRALMVSVLDVTALRRAQDDLRQLNRDLEARVSQEVTNREAAQTRAAHAERMQALGQLAGGIAHDFNNVLQAVAGSAALIERRPGDTAAVNRFVRLIIDAASRGATITRRMLAFARRGTLEAEAIDPVALLEGLREIWTYTLGAGIEIRLELPSDPPRLFADKGQLETVLVNLATNARDAMENGGILTVSAEPEVVTAANNHRAGLAPGAYVRLAVSDTGTGMDGTVLARVAEPFFTTKGVGKGTGLGLSMVKGFAEQSDGGFTVVSEPGVGTTVSLWLPQTDTTALSSNREAAKPESPQDTGSRVLLVDDDHLVRETLAAVLEAEGLTVLSAADGEDALSLLRTATPIDILITDLSMPGMNGLALIQAAQRLRSRLPAILLTGYAEDAAGLAVGGAVSGSYSLVRKPIVSAQLASRIAAMLESAK
jgi:PAS domain S-box-containing protein